MQHYTNSVIAFNGDRVANATITVTDLSGNAVTIYQDYAGTTPLTSTTTNNNGEFDFYVPAGRYNITASGVGISGYTISDEFIGIADSSVSPFIQSGTGAVARYAQDKMREMVSVKDFGAVGNGVADDTAAISLAIASNRTIRFPAGTYLISSQIIKSSLSNLSLVGDGRGISIILCSASSTFTNSAIGFSACDSVEVTGLTIDQNNNASFSATYPLFIAVSCTNTAFRNCHIKRYTYIGCAFNSCSNSYIEDNIIERDTAINSTNYAINVSSSVSISSGIIVRNNFCNKSGSIYSGFNIQIINNTFLNNKYGAGINTSQGIPEDNYGSYIITGNNCSYGTGVDTDGVNVAGMEILGYNNIITGNVCLQNGGVGIAALGFRNIIANNICAGNGVNLAGTSNYRSGILMGYASATVNSSNSFVYGNKCYDLGSSTQQYGYYEDSSSLTGISCRGNDFNQNATAAMFIQNATTGSYETQGWLSWTPVMTSSTGTITTVGTCAGKYKLIDKTVFFEFSCAITTNGTGAGYISITLPIAAAGGTMARFSGRENGVTGKMLLGYAAGGTECRVTYYDSTYPGANNAVMTVSGSYQSA